MKSFCSKICGWFKKKFGKGDNCEDGSCKKDKMKSCKVDSTKPKTEPETNKV